MIHLPHNGKFQSGTIHESDRDYWQLIAKDWTQCWLVMGGSIEVTDVIDDVTCTECVLAYGVGV